jgi:hypothetical protein
MHVQSMMTLNDKFDHVKLIGHIWLVILLNQGQADSK